MLKMNKRLKRLLSLVMALAVIAAMAPVTARAADGVQEWDTDGDGVLEILAIGNSFSVDALEYVYQIAGDLGIEKIVLGNLYKGGCTLATHAQNAKNDTAAYAWFYNDNGTWSRDTNTWKNGTEKTIGDALRERTWDFVSLQQASGSSGQPDTYNADLDALIQYVGDNAPGAKLVWHMTWAYQQNTTHSAFPTYGKNQMTMYNAIVSAVQSKIVANGNFDLIVPNGTAVQNSRTSLLGDTTTIDGYHMSRPYGRYLTSLMFVRAITGLDISDVAYAPSGVDAEEMAIAIESVNNAFAKPFEVTQSAYVKAEPEIPDEGYILLKPELHKGAYWHSVNADHYNTLVTDASNSKFFFATLRFTRETLPVGSIIILEDGWQYRPEGWITDAVQSSRADTTTASYVPVTEQWWGDYTIRGFNISKVGTPSIMDLSAEDIHKVFRIYVPEEKHVHTNTAVVTAPTCTGQGYTSYTCTLCGDSYASDYVNAAGHGYANGTCTVCDAEHPNLANYEGKVISILGDSISTFAGYIPVADGFNLEHRPRYPQSNLFSDVNLTWWMQTITALDAKLGINDSWAGSTVTNTITGNSGDLGEKAAMASLTRIRNLGANGTPDVILFYGGTNDIGRRLPIGSFDPAASPTEVDLTTTIWTTVSDAYVDAIMRLRYYYPEAEILAMLPTYTASYYTEKELAQYNTVFSAICEHYGIPYIDLRDCGISAADLPDGIHPDAAGMDYITGAVLDTLLNDMEMEAGEHIVHSVTHNLTGAESSLGYYKGVTHGKPFVTTITGENVTVSVTMGGADITDTAYAGGVVTVAAVTDDLVITAQGRVKPVYEDHLQQLPENLCCATNLWTSLVPENTYYTGSAWGNISGNAAYSITIPVAAGDQIWATSFQKSGTNGGSRNGIRLTWFDENGVLESVSPDDVYAQFAANAFVTAPAGAVAVNVVMWNGEESNEVYLLSRSHTWENGVCTGCGAVLEVVIPRAGSTLSYKSMIYVIDIFDLSGLDLTGVDLSKDAGLLVLTEAQYAKLNGAVTYDKAYARPGLTARADGTYYGKSAVYNTMDLYLNYYFIGYVKLADGTYVYSEPQLYGPSIYAETMRTAGETEQTRSLCVAMLNYISAIQTYKGISADKLVNASLTAEEKTLSWTDVELNLAPAVDESKQVEKDTAVFKATGKNLQLSQTVYISALYKLDTTVMKNASEAGTIFWTAKQFAALEGAPSLDNYGKGTKAAMKKYRSTADQWVSNSPAIGPMNMADTVYYYMGYVVDSSGNVHYSGVMSYTVEQYIHNKAGKGDALGELCKALYYYERAVQAVYQ